MKKFYALFVALGLMLSMLFVAPASADETVPCGTPAKAAVYENIEHPAVPAVTKTIPGTDGVWANWAPNDTQGPQDYVPVWPTDERGTWILHDQLPPGHEGPDGVYRKGEGNSPYFYRQAAVAEKVVVVTPAKEAWTEKRLVSKAVPAGEPCDKPRENPEPPVKTDTPVKADTPKVDAPDKTVKTLPEVPTAVAAGAEGLPNTGALDFVAGAIAGGLLIGAGATVLAANRRRGKHEV